MYVRITIDKACQQSRIGIRLNGNSVVSATDSDIGLHVNDKLCSVDDWDVKGAHHELSTSILRSMSGKFDVVVWRDHFQYKDFLVAGSKVMYGNIPHTILFFTK